MSFKEQKLKKILAEEISSVKKDIEEISSSIENSSIEELVEYFSNLTGKVSNIFQGILDYENPDIDDLNDFLNQEEEDFAQNQDTFNYWYFEQGNYNTLGESICNAPKVEENIKQEINEKVSLKDRFLSFMRNYIFSYKN